MPNNGRLEQGSRSVIAAYSYCHLPISTLLLPTALVLSLTFSAIRSKNLHTGPAYMASLREQEQIRQTRASQKPKLTSKNLHTGPAYIASLREQEQTRQYRESKKRGRGGGCTVM